jgi:cytochrome c5
VDFLRFARRIPHPAVVPRRESNANRPVGEGMGDARPVTEVSMSRALACGALGLALTFPGGSLAFAQDIAPMASHERGRIVYLESCATCHGPDGRGAPGMPPEFAALLPDFTDCSFATREPDVDWMAVSHSGGPARAFSPIMPAYGTALSDDDLTAVLGYMRTMCTSADWPRGELNLPRPLVTEKAFPEDEAVITTDVGLEGSGHAAQKLVYEKRFGARNQVEVIVPYTLDDGAGGWTGGFGDIALGAKRAVYHDLTRGTIFSVAGEVVLPTGSETRGFGSGTTIFEPFVSFGQILPRDMFVQAQAGVELPVDLDKAGREAFWRLVAGGSLSQGRFGRTWSPMLELVAARELESGARAEWDLVPQVQVTLSTRQHIMASLGVRVPVNERAERPARLLFYVLWDWFDGPLFGGW